MKEQQLSLVRVLAHSLPEEPLHLEREPRRHAESEGASAAGKQIKLEVRHCKGPHQRGLQPEHGASSAVSILVRCHVHTCLVRRTVGFDEFESLLEVGNTPVQVILHELKLSSLEIGGDHGSNEGLSEQPLCPLLVAGADATGPGPVVSPMPGSQHLWVLVCCSKGLGERVIGQIFLLGGAVREHPCELGMDADLCTSDPKLQGCQVSCWHVLARRCQGPKEVEGLDQGCLGTVKAAPEVLVGTIHLQCPSCEHVKEDRPRGPAATGLVLASELGHMPRCGVEPVTGGPEASVLEVGIRLVHEAHDIVQALKHLLVQKRQGGRFW
mmetsp:Transcript_31826/g.92456  ORF Transcript_31826/g.92456 Transcript_31826/m.92456 type:complete len:325 (-) Transcript_31826:391-1365(-)